MAALTAGVAAPDFSLPLLDGTEFSLAAGLRRGPVVLAFFKVSCPVCQYAFPYLERLYQAYRGKGVSLIGVSQNDRRDTAAFAREYGINFSVALDNPARYLVSNAYGLTTVPTFFYVTPGGQIEISSPGWVKSEVAAINGQLAAAIEGSEAALFRPGEQVAEWRAG